MVVKSNASVPPQPGINIEWQDVEISVEGGSKTVLNKISGGAKAGEILALIGTSGSGKSTLLNYISQRYLKSKNMQQSENSKLTANGMEYDLAGFKSFGCFLEQDDALFQGSTPRELFTFAATLRTDLS